MRRFTKHIHLYCYLQLKMYSNSDLWNFKTTENPLFQILNNCIIEHKHAWGITLYIHRLNTSLYITNIR